jgi:hypothetical protein
MDTNSTPNADVYARVTDKIVAALEAGVRPWMQPWGVEHAAGGRERLRGDPVGREKGSRLRSGCWNSSRFTNSLGRGPLQLPLHGYSVGSDFMVPALSPAVSYSIAAPDGQSGDHQS